MLRIDRSSLALVAAAAIAAGCGTAEPDGDPRPARSANSAATTEAGPSPSIDPLAVRVWDRKPGGDGYALRQAGDGTLMASWGTDVDNWSWFRLYTADLQPATPLLRLESAIENPVGTTTGFLIRSWVTSDFGETYDYYGWAEISSTGDITPVAVAT
jgi:hypothetical protein